MPHLLQYCLSERWQATKDALPNLQQTLPWVMSVQVVSVEWQVKLSTLPVSVVVQLSHVVSDGDLFAATSDCC